MSQQKAKPFWQTMPRSGNLTNGAAADRSTYVKKHFLSKERGKQPGRGCDVEDSGFSGSVSDRVT